MVAVGFLIYNLFGLVVVGFFVCFLSHEVIGIKLTTENYRNFKKFENHSKVLSPSFTDVLGESVVLRPYSETIQLYRNFCF